MSAFITNSSEQALVDAVGEAILLTKQGADPNSAIKRVVVARGFSAPFVHRMVEAFNKSASCYHFEQLVKEGGPDEFPLADANTILHELYPEARLEKAAAAEEPYIPFFVPSLNCATVDIERIEQNFMPKTAAASQEAQLSAFEDVPRTPRGLMRCLAKYGGACEKLRRGFRTKLANAQRELELTLQRAGTSVQHMQPRRLRKVAQNIVNGYPRTGQDLLGLLSAYGNVEFPELEKTANAAVFPADEPYLSVSMVLEQLRKVAAIEAEQAAFEKHADGFLSSLLANSAANSATGRVLSPEALRDILEKGSVPSEKTVEDMLDPKFFNQLREIEARRAFMNMALFDPDLKQYDFSKLVDAYNEAVTMVPDSVKNPVVLKNLMLSNMVSSGRKDPYQLAQELKLQKGMIESGGAMMPLPPEKETTERESTAGKGKARGDGSKKTEGGFLKGLQENLAKREDKMKDKKKDKKRLEETDRREKRKMEWDRAKMKYDVARATAKANKQPLPPIPDLHS